MGDTGSGTCATHDELTGCAVWSTKSTRGCRRVGGARARGTAVCSGAGGARRFPGTRFWADLPEAMCDDAERMEPTTVLLDLDGVIRHFDPHRVAAIETRHGLADGTLHGTAFESELLEQVVTGRIRRSDWIEEVGARVGHPLAASECFADHGIVDESMLAEVDSLRSQGVVVAVLTNGTDTIPAEMAALGIDSRFDAIFNSAELGVAKPDRLAFETVCSRLQVEPPEVLFTDDSASKLKGAIEIGMTAHLFEGVDAFRQHLSDAGFRAV